MNLFFPATVTTRDRTQSRLMSLAALALFLYALALTLAPAVRLHSWAVTYRWEHWGGYVIWLAGFSLLHREIMRRLPERDPYLLPCLALLSGLGLLTIWRLNINFGMRQTLWMVVCMFILWVGFRTRNLLALLRRYKYVWLVGGLLVTFLTFFFGTYPGGVGPQLWFNFGGIYLQPSEPLKLILIIYLAAYLADRLPLSFRTLPVIFPTLVLFGIAAGILIVQRDLGTTTLFIFLYAVILYFAIGKRRVLLISALLIGAAALAGYRFFDVIQIRIDAWINPWLDPSGNSYQIIQSLLAIAAGGIFGRGPGLGSPSLVPISHSDFIFASIAEEMGLAGTLILLGVFALFVVRGFITALRAPNQYQRFLAAGLTAYLGAQAILIIGGNLRLLPLTGVTLPFISYGGSSLLTSFACFGLILLVSSSEGEPADLPDSKPYQLIGALILCGFAATALINGYWSFAKSGSLQERADNPRRSISDLYALRGSLLDHNGKPIVQTTGESGSYERVYLVPALSATTGYTHPAYGQAGLEASEDSYLRGTDGNPASMIWSNFLMYSQPPAGLNVRTTLDLTLQAHADELLGDHTGAIVLLNSTTGEILSLASHPYIDPNNMDENWETWISDPAAPLVNRAVQGQYPIGAALGPFLLAQVSERSTLPALPEELTDTISPEYFRCARLPAEPLDWAEIISSGCPQALRRLGEWTTPAQLDSLYQDLGFYSAPSIPLETAPAAQLIDLNSSLDNLDEDTRILVSPLQMALAAATLSNGGQVPAPVLAAAVETPEQGWVILPGQSSARDLDISSLAKTAELLESPTLPIWDTVATSRGGESPYTWYIAGTLPDWEGNSLTVVVLLEESNPGLAQWIGEQLIQSAIFPGQ